MEDRQAKPARTGCASAHSTARSKRGGAGHIQQTQQRKDQLLPGAGHVVSHQRRAVVAEQQLGGCVPATHPPGQRENPVNVRGVSHRGGTRSPAAGDPGWAGNGGRTSASSWVEISSKHTTGRLGS